MLRRLVPACDGVILSPSQRRELWARFSTAAPDNARHSRRATAIASFVRDLGLGAIFLQRGRHAGLVHAHGIARPAFRQEQPQTQHERNFARGQRHQYHRLAVGILAPDQRIRLAAQGRFQRGAVPQAGPDQMMQPVIGNGVQPGQPWAGCFKNIYLPYKTEGA